MSPAMQYVLLCVGRPENGIIGDAELSAAGREAAGVSYAQAERLRDGGRRAAPCEVRGMPRCNRADALWPACRSRKGTAWRTS